MIEAEMTTEALMKRPITPQEEAINAQIARLEAWMLRDGLHIRHEQPISENPYRCGEFLCWDQNSEGEWRILVRFVAVGERTDIPLSRCLPETKAAAAGTLESWPTKLRAMLGQRNMVLQDATRRLGAVLDSLETAHA